MPPPKKIRPRLSCHNIGAAFKRARPHMRRACQAVSDSKCEHGLITWTAFKVMWSLLSRLQDTTTTTKFRLPHLKRNRAFWTLMSAIWVLAVKCVVDEDCDTNKIAAQTFPMIKSPRHVLRAELRLLNLLDWQLPRA